MPDMVLNAPLYNSYLNYCLYLVSLGPKEKLEGVPCIPTICKITTHKDPLLVFSCYFSYVFITATLYSRGPFRTKSSIYDGAF